VRHRYAKPQATLNFGAKDLGGIRKNGAPLMNFLAVNDDSWGGAYADPDLVSLHGHHHHTYIAVDNDFLADLSGENQHTYPSLSRFGSAHGQLA
jgi:hypothetical protein